MNTITKLTRHFLVLAALISSALSLSALTINVGYVNTSVYFTFTANIDADIYIWNLDTNEVVARGWYDYFSGCHAETYVEGPYAYGAYDSGEISNLTPGNYALEFNCPGTPSNWGFSNGWGHVTYAAPYSNYISFGVN
jgi:hypothetical protein